MSEEAAVLVRPARIQDIPQMFEILQPLVERRILLGKEMVDLYAATPEFLVAEAAGEVIGFGAVHVMWKQLGEVRTLAVADAWLGRGVGHQLLEALEKRALDLGLSRLFCLTFETGFFGRHGFTEVGEGESLVGQNAYAQLLRSHDEGVAEFLDLARVKPNTLGNTRMLKKITP